MKAAARGQWSGAKWFRSVTTWISLRSSGWLRAASTSRHAVNEIGIIALVQSGMNQNCCAAGVKNELAASAVAAIHGHTKQPADTATSTRIGKLNRVGQVRASRRALGKSKSWL